MGHTHLIVASALYLLVRKAGVSWGFDYPFWALVIGSLIPDIDHPNSLISTQLGVEKASKVVSKVVGHRGITHSLLASLVSFIILSVLLLYYHSSLIISVGFLLGYLSHLLADSLNPTGVEWLQPFRRSNLHFLISTGSKTEHYFFMAVGVLTVLIFIWT